MFPLRALAGAGARDGGDLPPCERVRSQQPRPTLDTENGPDAENGDAAKVRPGPVRMSAISIPPILRLSDSRGLPDARKGPRKQSCPPIPGRCARATGITTQA
ncbi:hypothetical protein GCM10009574_006130 [Streptomyces asiaticus]|uniref:Uncharacterized protein n=2 Tax=Streptomyces rhizosphaericus TaxID=114699 RepID=A0ABN1RPV3_9ACTN